MRHSFWGAVARHYDNYPLPDGVQNSKPFQPTAALDDQDAGQAPSTKCPLVRFRLRRTRLLDVDAKYGSVKDLLDGLAYAGLIHGDREGQIELEVRQEKVAHRKDEKTIIEIEY